MLGPPNFLHALILASAAAILIAITIYAWRRSNPPTNRRFAWLTLAMVVWTLGAALEAAAITIPTKTFFAQIQYLGLVCIPPLMLLFVLEYLQRLHKVPILVQRLLWVIPLITLALVWTNPWHHLVWTGFSPGAAGTNLLIYYHGPAYWIFVVYLYAIAAILALVLIREMLHTEPFYRKQMAIFLAATLVIGLSGFIYVFDLGLLPGLDWTPIGATIGAILFLVGISHLRLLDLAPMARDVLVDGMQDGMVVVDTQRQVVFANRAACQLFGDNRSSWIGQPVELVLPFALPILAGEFPLETMEFQPGSSPGCFIEVRRTDLFTRSGWLAGRLLVLRDITDRKQAELKLFETTRDLQEHLAEINRLKNELHAQSIRDPLTGLYNRRYLEETLGRELARATREEKPVSMLMLDIDHFKQINDTYGHPFGDAILQRIGELLRAHTRREDLACRYGGDEMIIVLPGSSAADTQLRAEQLCQLTADLVFERAHKRITITISAGIAVFPGNGNTTDELIWAADQALYRAKSQGRNRVVIYRHI